MSRRARAVFLALPLAASLAVAAWWAIPSVPGSAAPVGRPPRIRPDYADVVIPPNLAPLNFVVEEGGRAYAARLTGGGQIVEVAGDGAKICIPPGPWRKLLQASRGGQVAIEVFVKEASGQWRRFAPIHNQVAAEDIDPYLAYRLIPPLYYLWGPMGIYQRNLETFDEAPILRNDRLGGVCINCHSFAGNRPSTFSFHIRPHPLLKINGMVLVRGRDVRLIDTRTAFRPAPAAYTSWDASGSTAAFSINTIKQLAHGATVEPRDVIDMDSDLAMMDAASCRVRSTPAIREREWMETFPALAPDGKALYFSRAKRPWPEAAEFPPAGFETVRYDLARIRRNSDAAASQPWGNVETLVSADEASGSASQARVSPDGKYVMFTLSSYGSFPAFQSSSDLYLLEAATGKYRRMEINSDQADTWHGWSSNGRWIVFSSKRIDGLMSRPYLSYFDAAGRAHKPLLLPQKDPAFYDSCLKTFNLPELITAPVDVREEALVNAIKSAPPAKAGIVTGATPIGGNRGMGAGK